jgi:hypothetical protein
MDNYIVRVYRFERKQPRSIIGVVEEVGKQGKRAFANMDELWEIINPVKKTRRKTGSNRERREEL